MKLTLLILSLAGIFAIQSHAEEPPVKIEKAWIRAVPPISSDTAAYMTIVNTGKEPLKLTGGSTPIATMVHAMITTRKMERGTEVFGMELVDGIKIPAGGRAVLAPKGDHIMIMNMTSHPKAGETVKLTLRFDPGGREITLNLPVSNTQPE
jgi:copper(I)-binding protein